MKRLALLGVLALLAGALVLGSRGSGSAPDRADGELTSLRTAAALAPCPAGLAAALPALTLPCVGADGEVTSRTAPGRPTVVNVWATWCGPCVREVPLLQSLHERTDAVDVVGVLTQDTVENGLRFASDPTPGFGMDYASVLDANGVVMREFGPGPPITLFVTADGRIAHTEVGEMTSQAEVDGLVRRHLGVTL
ncbi:MAG: Redoxin domain protein [Frankiales bacterium]|nr:Redoxin domain protein [Frankiales bacterium]